MITISRRLSSILSALAMLDLALALAATCGLALAQTGTPAVATTTPAPTPTSTLTPGLPRSASVPATTEPAATSVRNGFAENLRPTVKRKAAQPQPYAPITKQDDHGQIPEIEMFVGESRVFPAPNIGRIAVGNGQIMTAAALDKKEVIVFANAAGTSSLFVWNEDGRYQRLKINIVAGDTSRVAREVAGFLATIPNAKASIVGDKVIVDGDNLSDADLAKIDQLEKRYPQIVNFTNRVGWEQMVMMDVKVVEFPKSELKEIGLKWGAVGGTTLAASWLPIRYGNPPPGSQLQLNIPASQSGLPITSATGIAPLPSALNIVNGLNLGLSAQLNLLEQEGKASVLAEPQLSARNGAKASFLAGGEFPYSVSNVNGVTIIFKPYGIKLDISPKVDRNGVIRATIQSEVSSIDASVTAVGGPALLTRRTDTEFNVHSGETIVLSGLLQRNASTDIDKVPLLGDLPVLGALFRSKRFQNKETELIVFVTPTVVDSRSPGLVDRIDRATQRLEQQMGPQPYLSNPLQPGEPAAGFNKKPARDPAGATILPAALTTAPASALPGVSMTTPAPVSGNARSTIASAGTGARSMMSTLKTGDMVHEDGLSGGGSLLQVVVRRAQLRAGPTLASPSLLQLAQGAVVRLGDRPAEVVGTTTWRPVVVGTVDGWIVSAALAPVKLGATVAADRDDAIAALAIQGKTVGRQVAAAPVLPASTVRQDRSALPSSPLRYKVLLDGLAMRLTPDINALTVSQLALGSMVEALPGPDRGYWTAVRVGDQRGWVATQWLMPHAAAEQ
ncbi:MAG: pilus assembly protein N-terminal domain-containing protein [Herminiimonas sp.]|nr:pilus assembly protein N-terminal domain-containing protein [Herminiimonas sp.]